MLSCFHDTRRILTALRCQLFEDVIIQLDSAAGEASEGGNEELCDYIVDVLIPFIRDEQIMAGLAELE